jgi:hypothetical protein
MAPYGPSDGPAVLSMDMYGTTRVSKHPSFLDAFDHATVLYAGVYLYSRQEGGVWFLHAEPDGDLVGMIEVARTV